MSSIEIALIHLLKYNYPNGKTPLIKHTNLVSKYQGCLGIELGTGLTFPGFLITFFFNPMNEPIKTRGEEQHNHNRSKAKIVENGTLAEDPSNHKLKLIKKNIPKAKDGYNKAVTIPFFNHSV
jgi:hypothetical protein